MQVLRTALVGFGLVAERRNLPAYLASMQAGGPFDVVAVVDRSGSRQELARRFLPKVRTYADPTTMFAAEAGRIDCVHVATPPCDHAAIAHAALDHGLHVLGEAPLTVSRGEATSVLAHAKRVRRVIYPAHAFKHTNVARAVRNALDEGRIGDVRLATLAVFEPTHALGAREWHPDWRRHRAIAGGGVTVDRGAGAFCLLFDWLRAYPSAVSAKTTTSRGHETEDNASLTLAFPGSRIATVQLSWTAGMHRTLATLHGERGAIRVEDDEVEIVRAHRRRGGTVEFTSERERISEGTVANTRTTLGSAHSSVLDGFASAIASDDFVSNETQDALRCVELVAAAYRSADQSSREIHLGPPEDNVFAPPRAALSLVHSTKS